MELTAVAMRGQTWWTFGFEAEGPADGLQSLLTATATLVLHQAMPDGLQLTTDESGSYSRWLQQHSASSSAQLAQVLQPHSGLPANPQGD